MVTAGRVGLVELEKNGLVPLTLIKRPAIGDEADEEGTETIVKPIQEVLDQYRVFN